MYFYEWFLLNVLIAKAVIFLTGFTLLNFCIGNYGGDLLSVAFSLSSSKK